MIFINTMERYYSFNNYLKQIFGERVHRIGLNVGFNCPNLDGTKSSKGCIFCNNKSFIEIDNDISVEEQIRQALKFFSTSKRFRNIKKFIAYFQAYTNTYGTVEKLKQVYDIVKNFPQIVGIFISTRPDCIDEEKLRLINSYTEDYLVWIEYGMQTSDNNILTWLNRGHTYEDLIKAVELTKKFPKINIGIHLILGLPGQDVIKDAKEITKLKISGVKIHLLHVLKNTPLERLYYEHKIKILTEEEYVREVCNFLEFIPSSVVILRLISTAKDKFLVAPRWMNNKFQVIKNIEEELVRRNSFQGIKIEKMVSF